MQTRADSCLAVNNFALGKNVHAMRDVPFYKYGKELQGSVSLMAPQSVILRNLKETGHNSETHTLISVVNSSKLTFHKRYAHICEVGEDAENDYSSEASQHNATCIPV